MTIFDRSRNWILRLISQEDEIHTCSYQHSAKDHAKSQDLGARCHGEDCGEEDLGRQEHRDGRRCDDRLRPGLHDEGKDGREDGGEEDHVPAIASYGSADSIGYCRNRGEDRACRKLHGGQGVDVEILTPSAQGDDVGGEEDRAYEDCDRSPGDLEAIEGEDEKPARCHHDCDPPDHPHFRAEEEDGEDGSDHHIETGDESSDRRRRKRESECLEDVSECEECAGDTTLSDQTL